jgi:protein-tyrosine phosphatase
MPEVIHHHFLILYYPHTAQVKDLAAAVAQLKALVDGGHRVYVHCTAGLGRAPAVIIAYLHWTAGMNLEESYR